MPHCPGWPHLIRPWAFHKGSLCLRDQWGLEAPPPRATDGGPSWGKEAFPQFLLHRAPRLPRPSTAGEGEQLSVSERGGGFLGFVIHQGAGPKLNSPGADWNFLAFPPMAAPPTGQNPVLRGMHDP